MKKIFAITILLLLILVGVTLMINREQPAESVPTTPTFPTGNNSTDPVVISTQTVSAVTPGGVVQVADVRIFPEVKELGDGMYHLQGTRSEPDAGFAFLYSFRDNSVAIAIETEPLAQNRLRASQYLLELLEISENDACKLNVYVGIPYDVSHELAGTNFGLSFCPNSLPL